MTKKKTEVGKPAICMVCGRPKAEHSPEEIAAGCKRNGTMA